MAKFELFSTAHSSVMPVAIRATEDGGFVGLFLTTTLALKKDGTLFAKNEFTASIFEGDDEQGVARVVKDRKVASTDTDIDLDLPALVPLKNGGFGIYQTTYADDAPPSTRVDIHDENGVRQSTLTVKNKPVQLFGEIDRGFGSSASQASFVDFETGTIQRISLENGKMLSARKIADAFFVVHGLDAGHVVSAIGTDGPEVDFVVNIPTLAGERPVYREKFGPAGSFAAPHLMFTAGNAIVMPVAVFDGTDLGLEFAIRRPDDAKFAKSVDLSKPGYASVFATTELDGVGFAIFSAYTKLSKPGVAADAVLRLFDFEGDLIAQRTVKSAIGERLDFINRELVVTELNGLDADSGIRLMPSWSVTKTGKTVLDTRESWFGDVFEFNVALDNRGTSLADSMRGLGKADRLRGDDGDDMLAGGGGKDALFGGKGHDALLGESGNDTLDGGDGKDDLRGGDGADKLFGGRGGDKLRGGGDDDQFRYRSVAESREATGIDRILDFSLSDGDTIHLTDIDANTKRKGNQAFTFIGEAEFTKKAGELRIDVDGRVTRVLGDVDGDGQADLEIALAGKLQLEAGDFVL